MIFLSQNPRKFFRTKVIWLQGKVLPLDWYPNTPPYEILLQFAHDIAEAYQVHEQILYHSLPDTYQMLNHFINVQIYKCCNFATWKQWTFNVDVKKLQRRSRFMC